MNLIDPSGHKECGVSSDCSEIPTWFHDWRSSILQRGANAIVSLLPAPPRAVPGGWRSTSVNYRDSFGKYATDSAPDGDVYIYYRVDANSKDDLLGFERVGRSILQENEAGFLYDDANYQEEYAGTFPKDPIAMAYIQFHKIADANYEWDKVHNDHQAAEPRLTITGNYSPKASDRAHWVALGVEQGWLYDTSWGADRYFHVDHRASYDGGTRLETTIIGNYAVYGDVTSASLYFQGWSGPFFSEGGPYSWQVNKNLPVP